MSKRNTKATSDPPKKRPKRQSKKTIIENLEFEDLLNVAETSNQMLQAARLAVKMKYNNTYIRLYNLPRISRRIVVDAHHTDEIWVYDFASCLKVMRCFGQSISRLWIESSSISSPECDKMVADYLNEYCTESIYELGYFGRALRSPTKQYKNVQILHLNNYTFAEQSELPTRFPNVRQLKFNNMYPKNRLAEILNLDDCTFAGQSELPSRFLKLKFNAVNFPHLEHFDGSFKPLETQFLVKFIQLNPQLQSLKLHGRLGITFFEAFSGGHSFEYLDLRAVNFEIQWTERFNGTKSFRINGVKKLLINGYSWLPNLPKVSIWFHHIEEIIVDRFGLSPQFIDFIKENPSISKFTSSKTHDKTYEDRTVDLFAKSLPSVVECHIACAKISVVAAIGFLKECKLLKIFEFKLQDKSDYDAMKGRLDTEWRSTVDESGCVKLER